MNSLIDFLAVSTRRRKSLFRYKSTH